MGYISTVTLYSTLLAFGYLFALFRRGKNILTNGNKLHGTLPPLKPLYVHALLSMIFKPKRLPQHLLSQSSMPKLSLISKTVAVQTANLAAYRTKCGYPNSKELPIIYLTVESFCLNLACMCLPAFPISVIGGVLARYKATMYKPIHEAEILTYKQALLPTVRQTEKGDTEFDMSVTVSAATGELLWEDTSTFLSFGRQRNTSKATSQAEPDVRSWQESETWSLSTQAGPQFAALNGDINFIHLHPLIARAFGFKSNVAHGTYLVSKGIAAMQKGVQMQYPQTVSASFIRPAFLPGNFTCHWKAKRSNHACTTFGICSEATRKAVILGEYACGQDAMAKF